MLRGIGVKNFTVFGEANFEFAPGLNVIIGENGSGKSHLLKLVYSLMAVSAEEGRKTASEGPTKGVLQSRVADKLVGVLRPDYLGRLVRRRRGRERCEVKARFEERALDVAFSFASQSRSEVVVDRLPAAWLDKAPVFLPTRELLTIYPGFASVYDSHYLEFEETYRDTCLLLGAPPVRGPREKAAAEMLRPLEQAMGGKVEVSKTGRFYLNLPGQGKLEMPLVAEGLRKLAMLSRLIATGSLLDKGYLIWDEPETNLNPRLIRLVARSIFDLASRGIQVFVATHSLFLLKELDVLARERGSAGPPTQYFALSPGEQEVMVDQGPAVDDVQPIVALDEELLQSDRFLEAD